MVTPRVAPPPRDAAIAIDAPPPPPPHPEEVLVPATAKVPAFYLDREETTIADYLACIAAKQCTSTNRAAERVTVEPRVAIDGVTFDQARGYCAWRGKRLPTAAEWKQAAYGHDPRAFPWGDEPITCERAWIKGCGAGDRPTQAGRPTGASPVGALDMLGNVGEWTDDGHGAYVRTCATAPPTSADLLGGDAANAADSPWLRRDNPIASTPRDFDNPRQGIRCARSITLPAPPPAILDPELRAMVEGGALVVEPAASATAAFARAEVLCASGKRGLPLAGELAGERGWLVATDGAPTLDAARALAAPGAKVIAAPTGLVRILGTASCGSVANRSTLRVTSPKHRWKLVRPTSPAPYQLWLEPATIATLAIECERPGPHGECDFATTTPGPVQLPIPAGPRAGFEGPSFQVEGGYVCD